MTPGRRRLTSAAAYVLVAAACFAALAILWDRLLAGFPDGHVTAHDRALYPVQLIAAFVCLICAARALLEVGWRRPVAVGLIVSLWGIFALAHLGLWGMSAYFATYLDHGQGG